MSVLHQLSPLPPPSGEGRGAEMNELERLLCASSMRKGTIDSADWRKMDKLNFVKLYKKLNRIIATDDVLDKLDSYYEECSDELQLLDKRNKAMEEIEAMSEEEFTQKLLQGKLPEFERAFFLDDDYPIHKFCQLQVDEPELAAYETRSHLRITEANDHKHKYYVEF